MDMSSIINKIDTKEYTNNIAERFRGFLPVVVDVETGGFNSRTDAMLEIAAVILEMDGQGNIQIKETHSKNIDPFPGAVVEKAALEFTGIDIYDPERMPEEEGEALRDIFRPIRHEISATGCTRSVMVAHNAHFDLGFVNAAVNRNQIKRNPFHPFSCFDTSTLAGLVYGQTVLAKACQAAKMDFDNRNAHSALYDAVKTAELFCGIVNRWKDLGGWPLETDAETEAE
ncbi:ribonuclease T [Porticoccaceae bacterium]|nr:ribonuclease T [Porticoccaceae bacterium]MDB9992838.1 ribonuclease T [Porticoccaceae bacterium]MDC0089812.1 ribonuclease T [Porticoccaceae bacterium]MDC1512650.1 ribonuclease T [Porticoccaceae bacterium]